MKPIFVAAINNTAEILLCINDGEEGAGGRGGDPKDHFFISGVVTVLCLVWPI